MTWLFVGIAVLFNPLAPVYLDRATWQPLDIAAAICFVGLARARTPGRSATRPA